MFYRIRDWSSFENNRTKEMKLMQWVATPIKLDGIGYCLIMDLDDGGMIFGFWNALLQVAARCEVRGTLKRGSGQAHDIKSLALITRFKKADVERALFVLSGGEDPDIDWIEKVYENGETADNLRTDCGQPAEIPQEGAGCLRHITEHNITEHNKALSLSCAHTREDGREFYPDLENFVLFGLMNFGHLGATENDWREMFAEISAGGWADTKGRPWLNWKSKLGYFAKDFLQAKKSKRDPQQMLNKNISLDQMTREIEYLTSRPKEESKGVLRL